MNKSSFRLTAIHWERTNLYLKAPETELFRVLGRNGSTVESASPKAHSALLGFGINMPRDLQVKLCTFVMYSASRVR